MTKNEYNALRRQYRYTCKDLFNAYKQRADTEFCLSDKAIILYNAYLLALREFARLTGCTDKQAADALNIEY